MLDEIYRHFGGQAGRERAEAFNAATEGLPIPGDGGPRGALNNWLNGDHFQFYGFNNTEDSDYDPTRLFNYKQKWGGNVTDLPYPFAQKSVADTHANRGGLRFWSDVTPGSTFDICKFITKGWHEQAEVIAKPPIGVLLP